MRRCLEKETTKILDATWFFINRRAENKTDVGNILRFRVQF